MSSFFQDVSKLVPTRQAFTSAYNPQTNGKVDRFNQTILVSIRNFTSENGTDWDWFDKSIDSGYNKTLLW